MIHVNNNIKWKKSNYTLSSNIDEKIGQTQLPPDKINTPILLEETEPVNNIDTPSIDTLNKIKTLSPPSAMLLIAQKIAISGFPKDECCHCWVRAMSARTSKKHQI